MKILLLCIGLCYSFTILFPQVTDTLYLEDVSISVTPFQQKINTVTGSLSILQLNDAGIGESIILADQLNTSPGIYMSSGTPTTNRLSIRGIGSRTPYSSNRIRAYYNDIPVTNGDGVSSLEDFNMLGISRLEILKGSSSALYGSGLGGAVKIVSTYPSRQGFSARGKVNYGSFNNSGIGFLTEWKKGNHAITAGYAKDKTDGYRENSNYERNNIWLDAKSEYKRNSFNLHLLFTGLSAGIPSSLSFTDFQDEPQSAAANWLAVKGFEESKKILGGLTWKHSFNELWQNSMTVFSTWHDPYESRPFNILDESSVNAGLRNFIQFSDLTFRMNAGIEFFYEYYNWKIYETLSGLAGPLQLENKGQRKFGNLFFQMEWEPLQSLKLDAGINLNILQYRIETKYQFEGIDQTGDYTYEPVLSPRIGLNYSIAPDHFFHAAAGHGFSAPSTEETLLPEGLINNNLKPETGWNIETGFRGWLFDRRWFYDATIYVIFVRNMLVTKRISEDIFTGINAGSARFSGLEVYNRFHILPPGNYGEFDAVLHTSIFFNNNRFTHFVDDGNDFSGNTLPGIPQSMMYARLETFIKKHLGIVPEISYTGAQLVNDSNTGQANGFLIVNLSTRYKVIFKSNSSSVSFNAGIKNLFNKKYASMILVNAPSFGAGEPRYYYPGLPRNFFAGISLILP